MSNKEIAAQFKKAAALLDLHNADTFKAKGYASAAINIERHDVALVEKDKPYLLKQRFSENMANRIIEVIERGTFTDLEELLEQTPKGVVEMMNIKGIGGKKIGLIWRELNITSLDALMAAAEAGEVAKLKGFGEKTEQQILEQIKFLRANAAYKHYAAVALYADEFCKELEKLPSVEKASAAGDVRRAAETVAVLDFVVATTDAGKTRIALNEINELAEEAAESGPYHWKGYIKEINQQVHILFTTAERYGSALVQATGSGRHLAAEYAAGKPTLYQLAQQPFATEEALYKAAGLPLLPPETREGLAEFALAEKELLGQLVEQKDIKGVVHCHSSYSDGKNSLREMVEGCRSRGYKYLLITDHSQAAFYANGLTVDRLHKQFAEIDELNKEFTDFKIFKGIESDILNDGHLDYEDEVLALFDGVVISVHSNLKMDVDKATARVVKAIEHPATSILGHPTGRLLLKRPGYPLHMEKVLDACAANGVAIEINANPWRLDIDWRWLPAALERDIKICINPDAHQLTGIDDIEWGVLAGRKGGLLKEQTLNALSADAFGQWLQQKKAGKLAAAPAG